VVVLTWNEERNVVACLRSLARQGVRDMEVIVLDAASHDGTVTRVQDIRSALPFPLRLEVAATRTSIGAARNRGVALAKAPAVAFLSADAEAEPGWARAALDALATHDLVFGRQVHAPRRWTVGASVRGLRYRFPDHADGVDPLPLASNVAAAYRREVLLAHPFDPTADAAEDLLLARRAAAEGRRIAYEPRMAVLHHDVEGARAEARKALREGRACGEHAGELGFRPLLLAWGACLAAAAALAAWRPSPGTLAFASLVLLAPALRRAARHLDAPPRALALGLLASPAFDLLFLGTYLVGLVAGLLRRPAPTAPQEVQR
jgi:hypothetical protein